MIFYLFLILLFFIFFILADFKWPYIYQRKLILLCPYILLIVISIFRFDVGYDYPTYYEMSNDINDDGVERLEPLSYCLVVIASFIQQPFVIFILFGLPTYILYFIACKQTKNMGIAFWTFIFLFWLDTFGVVRQAIAMSIIAYAITAMQNKKMYTYILLCIIASLFHLSALVMLPIYFVYHYASWKWLLVLMLGFVFVFDKIVSLFLDNELYVSYFILGDELEGGSIILYFYIGLYILLLVLSYKYHLMNDTKKFFVAMLPGFFFPFLLGGHLGGRIAMYFYIIFIYLIPIVLSKSSPKIRMAFMIMLCSFFFALLFVSSRNPNKSPYTPYQTIFEVDLEHPVFK